MPAFAKASAGHLFAPSARCGWLATRWQGNKAARVADMPAFAKASAGHLFAPSARCGWLATRSPQGEGWWRGLDSNQRTHSGQIYSLLDLTTLPPLHRVPSCPEITGGRDVLQRSLSAWLQPCYGRPKRAEPRNRSADYSDEEPKAQQPQTPRLQPRLQACWHRRFGMDMGASRSAGGCRESAPENPRASRHAECRARTARRHTGQHCRTARAGQ